MSDHEKCVRCGRVRERCKCEQIQVRPEASEFIMGDAPLVLTEKGHRFAGNWKCGSCGAELPAQITDGSWRWKGDAWEHRCDGMHPQAGHSEATYGGPARQGALFPEPPRTPDEADDG